jgi:hypothetical protein
MKDAQPRRTHYLASALVCLSSWFSCAAPIQSGGVETRPGAIERLAYLCRIREADRTCLVESAEDAPAPTAPPVDGGTGGSATGTAR